MVAWSNDHKSTKKKCTNMEMMIMEYKHLEMDSE
jgi:hypothetical protein